MPCSFLRVWLNDGSTQPSARRLHTPVWTGSEMIVRSGTSHAGSESFNDTFSYTPDVRPFDFNSVVGSGGTLTPTFPTVTVRTYTLWRSDTLTDGTWTNTGLPALTGSGFTRCVPYPSRS